MAIVTTYINKGGLTNPWEGFRVANYESFRVYILYNCKYAGSCWDVFVKGGRIYWGNKSVDMEDSDPITIPANSTAHRIWLQADDVTKDPPVITYENDPAGWMGFPLDSSTPKKYWLLAEVESNDYGIINIVDYWH